VSAAGPASPARLGRLAPLPLLTLVNFFNYLDRQIVYGMLSLIGDDLALSKVQMGWLGTANLLVFALVSLLSGPLADRFGPRLVLSSAIALWSLATLASAAAPSYEILLICRAVVGVGEGVYGPGSNALLCAASPPERRGRALGIYNVGMALGGTLGIALGAVLGPVLGWRCALLIAGLPSFVLAAASVFVAVPASAGETASVSARAVLSRPVFLLAVGGGTDVAIESADVVLTGGDLRGAVNAIALSRATMRNIRQNLVWAFGYNVVLIPVAAGLLFPLFGWLLSPMLAAGAMALSSVSVLTNALRLRGFRTRFEGVRP